MPDSYSLVPQETNVGSPANPSSCGANASDTPSDVAFRHSGWQPTRHKIRAALDRSGVAESRLLAWDACGTGAWVLRDPDTPGRFRIASSTCHDRFCVPCANARSQRIGNRLRLHLAELQISFLTLTLRDSDLPLGELLDKLLRSFRILRQWKIWKREVAGGVAFIEIKWNDEKQRWHPHIHAIMDSGYIPQSTLSDRWCEITKGSFKVDIRRPRDNEHAISYVTRYGSKPLNQSFVDDPQRLDEAIAALKGRHMATVFGNWRGWCLTDDDEHEKWLRVASLSEILSRERRGDPEAIQIMRYLRCTIQSTTTPEVQPRASPPIVTSYSASHLIDLHSVCDAVRDLVTSLGLHLPTRHSA